MKHTYLLAVLAGGMLLASLISNDLEPKALPLLSLSPYFPFSPIIPLPLLLLLSSPLAQATILKEKCSYTVPV